MEHQATQKKRPEEDFGAYFPHEVWEVKTIPIDLMLADGRATILGLRDGFTGRAKFFVIPFESASAISGAIAATIDEWSAKPIIIEIDSSRLVYASLRPASRTLCFILKMRRASQSLRKSSLERLFNKVTINGVPLGSGFMQLTSNELQRRLDEWTSFFAAGGRA